MAARRTKSIGRVRYWPADMPPRDKSLREQNLIGNVLAHMTLEIEAQRNGLPCVVGGISTTSVRMAKKMARWDA